MPPTGALMPPGMPQGQPGMPMAPPPDEPCPQCQGTGEVEKAPAVPAGERKAFEDCETDWVYWKDFLWSPCRTWHERRWVAFKAEMTRDEMEARFGPIAKRVPLKQRKPEGDDNDSVKDVWSRAEVWEIWSEQDRKVYWYVEGFHSILDAKPDPLGLEGFFPCPQPLISNPTTTKYIPKPDYVLVQDLYAEVDELTVRIRALVKSAKVVGIYDAASPDIKRLLDEACENELIPAQNWGALLQKGGLAASMQFLPLDQIVAAIGVLVTQRNNAIANLFQVTGRSDIMRGQAQNDATATEQRIKAGFASSRAQVDQDEFARFASDLSQLRAEVIAKHFDAETIIARSNVMNTADGKNPDDPTLPIRAAEFLKSKLADYRIAVRPESISLPDLTQQKQEGVEFLGALGQFLQAIAPIAQQAPTALPFLLEMLKWAMARFRGASSVEGVLDRALAEAQKPRPPAPPDPKILAQQEKAKADVQRAQLGIQATQAQTQAKVIGAVSDIARTRAKAAAQPGVLGTPPLPALPGIPSAPGGI